MVERALDDRLGGGDDVGSHVVSERRGMAPALVDDPPDEGDAVGTGAKRGGAEDAGEGRQLASSSSSTRPSRSSARYCWLMPLERR